MGENSHNAAFEKRKSEDSHAGQPSLSNNSLPPLVFFTKKPRVENVSGCEGVGIPESKIRTSVHIPDLSQYALNFPESSITPFGNRVILPSLLIPGHKNPGYGSSCSALPGFDFALSRRCSRSLDANAFLLNFQIKGGPVGRRAQHHKTCIWSSGAHTWEAKSPRITWIAVHGIDSICVVTMKEDLGFTEKINAELFRRLKEAVISEMEDLADLSSNLRKRLNLQIQKPFAVVSVNSMPQEESGHEEASRAMYDEGKALRFLQKEIESGSKFTSIETLRTAVSAFLCLFQRELAADEILVSVLDEGVFPVNVKICNHGEDLAVIRPPGNPADVFTVQRPSK